jgi:hypothetical protein
MRFNQQVKNPDAWYKYMVYSGIENKKIESNYKVLEKDKDAEIDTDTFEYFYKTQLEEDMYKKPRQVVEEDYEPRKIMDP